MKVAAVTASALLSLVPPTTAVSKEGAYVSKKVMESRRRLQDTCFLGMDDSEVFEELYCVAKECRMPNWDGYGAAPVQPGAISHARRLVDALPIGTPAPSAGVEPDGQVTLEWHKSPRRTLSVSVSQDGELHYAALLGACRNYGTEPFFGNVPKTILDLISRVNSR